MIDFSFLHMFGVGAAMLPALTSVVFVLACRAAPIAIHPHCVCWPELKRVCNNPFTLLPKLMQEASNL